MLCRLNDRKLFQPLIHISAIPDTDSSTLHFMAVSQAGTCTTVFTVAGCVFVTTLKYVCMYILCGCGHTDVRMYVLCGCGHTDVCMYVLCGCILTDVCTYCVVVATLMYVRTVWL